jgi:MscS family membrane protein
MTATNLDRRIFEATDYAAQYTFFSAGLMFSWRLYGEHIIADTSALPWLNDIFLMKVADHICFLLLAFSILYFLWKILFSTLDWFEFDLAPATTSSFDDKIVFSTRKVVKVLFAVLVVMVLADHFEWPISKVWAAAGIGSLAIAFAAKDTFSHMISGIIILFDRPFLVVDRVELADGTFGDVVDIGLRSTKILSFDNTIHIIPNSEISNQRITNHTYPDTALKLGLSIGVAYGTDLVRVKKILNEILESHPLIIKEPPWGIWFTEFGDSSLNIFMRCWIQDYREKFNITDQINMEIKRRFEEENIEVPFPQRDIHIIRPKDMQADNNVIPDD